MPNFFGEELRRYMCTITAKSATVDEAPVGPPILCIPYMSPWILYSLLFRWESSIVSAEMRGSVMSYRDTEGRWPALWRP